jgi:hypothetical protein
MESLAFQGKAAFVWKGLDTEGLWEDILPYLESNHNAIK